MRRSRKPEVLMQQYVIVATGRPSEQTQLIVGIHAAALYPSAIKMVAPGNFIPTHFMTGLGAQHPGDLVPQSLRHALIRIHAENPFRPRLLDAERSEEHTSKLQS